MKIDRIISIIMLLLERKKMNASVLADMFEVSTRTIYRDIEAINQAGIPIVTYPGFNGGIGIMEKYKIEKKLFTLSDITAILTGLGSIPPDMTGGEVLNTIAKIRGMVSEEQARDIQFRMNQISIDHSSWFGNKKLTTIISEIKNALSLRKYLSFSYSDRNGVKSRRKIEPYRMLLKESNWYIQGFCTLRNDFRIFRLSRISDIEASQESFIPRHFDESMFPKLKDSQENVITVKLLIDNSILDKLQEHVGEENTEKFTEEKSIVRIPFRETDSSYNFLMQLGSKCECLEPDHVRAEIIGRLKSMLSVYEIV
ncbi:MAG: YafY family transcriptional regulator [Firmicutes bacterium]|nr:YafY family transcriptional regulator [Bacillota bacterium]